MFVAFFSVSPCLPMFNNVWLVKLLLWQVISLYGANAFGCVVFACGSHSLGSVVLRCNFIWSPPLGYGRIHFKFQHVTGKWVQNHRKWSCCYAVAMLPFCFLWSLSTRGDHRYVIYGGSWFVCGNMGVGNKLKAAELNAYLVANYKDSILVAKTFQNLKMCRGLYTRVKVGVAKKIAQLQNFDRLYLGHFLSEIHKWPLIFFVKSYILLLRTFCRQSQRKKFWREVPTRESKSRTEIRPTQSQNFLTSAWLHVGSRAAYANPRLIADAGRRSVVQGSNAVSVVKKKRISSLSETILS